MKHKHIALVVGLLLVSLVACGTQAATDSSLAKEFVPADASSLIRVSDEAAVVVDVTPLNLDSPEAGLILQVGLNTHSVDLSYDISQIAVLRTSQGVEIPAQVLERPNDRRSSRQRPACLWSGRPEEC